MGANYHKATCTYLEYQDFIRKELVPKGIISALKLREYINNGGYLPSNMPKDPNWYFKRQAHYPSFSYTDLFGEYTVKEIRLHDKRDKYLPYNLACEVVRTKKFKTIKEYRAAHHTLFDYQIPYAPEQIYLNFNWNDFLGIKNRNGVHNSKLKRNDVDFIRTMLRKNIPMALLAKQFLISETQIKRIKTRENWK